MDPVPIPSRPRLSPGKRLFSVALTLAGVALFVRLVVASGFSWRAVAELGWIGYGLLFLASVSTRILHAVAWQCTLRHVSRPPLRDAFALSVAGFALTDGLPGGFVLGEWYKMEMLRRWHGLSLPDAAASQLIIKLELGVSHSLFVLAGIVVSYAVLRDRSLELFGSSSAHLAILGVTIGFGLLLLLAVALIFGGLAFSRLAAALGRLPIPPLRRWLARKQPEVTTLDQRLALLFHDNRRNLVTAFALLVAGWLLQSLDSVILLHFLGLSAGLATAFSIEAVGSIARLVLFALPSGIGAQDAVFVALFRSHGLYGPASGAFLLVKRAKDLCWIAIGLLILLLVRRAPAR